MATTENIGLITTKDGDGNKHLLYPITKVDAIDGLVEGLSGDFYTRTQTLTDSTKTEFGLDSTAVPDDAFADIAVKLKLIQIKKAYITLTVKTEGGNALPGILITNLLTEDGNTVKTDSNGVAKGYVSDGSVTLSISDYADVQDYSKTYTFVQGTTYRDEWSVIVNEFMSYSSSKTVKFSSNVTRVDVSVGGGGGGGGCGDGYQNGGGGGYAAKSENVTFSPETSYAVIVGSGGSGTTSYSNNSVRYLSGSAGGSSSFLGVSANGGRGGGNSAGTGNGDGGTGAYSYSNNSGDFITKATAGGTGTGTIYSSFTEEITYGGGGGGAGYNNTASDLAPLNGAAGGSPAGGAGGNTSSSSPYVTDGTAGIDGRGGGGGGGGFTRAYSKDKGCYMGASGKGGRGVVAIRMYLAVAS